MNIAQQPCEINPDTAARTKPSMGRPGNLSATSSAAKTYTCGTLIYTRMGLIGLFASLLWGDFCFSIMETVISRVLPLQLRGLGASNLIMGLFVTTIPGVLNMVLTPMVGFQSDRYRSRWGRRIPFLFWPTPFLALFLVAFGFSNELGHALHEAANAMHVNLSALTAILAIIGVCVVLFQFVNMYVASVYYYLFNDVVPEKLLGRFMSLFRLFDVTAGFIFSMFIFKYSETHAKEIYVGCGLLYFVGFMIMCWGVREGQYPPPPNTDENPSVFTSFKTYFHECFTHRFYVYFFLATALGSMAGSCGTFMVFFQKAIGLNLETIGAIGAWLTLPSMILLYPAGHIIDRFHPLRLYVLCALLQIPLTLLSFFFIHGMWSFILFSIIYMPLGVVGGAANLPMYMTLLPKERFGQFCSAQALFDATFRIAGGFLAGYFMDWATKNGTVMANYRYAYIWMFVLQIVAMSFLLLLYRQWVHRGGKEHYTPPSVDRPAGPV